MTPAQRLAELSDEEAAALHSAASWYARYHALDIAAEVEDTSGAALEERRRFLALVRGLAKLGTPMPLPDALAREQVRAA